MKNNKLPSFALWILIISTTTGCVDKTRNSKLVGIVVEPTITKDQCHIVDLDQIDYLQTLPLSEIFGSVQTVILESSENSIIGRISSLQTHNDKIIILDKVVSKGVFVFDKSGAYLYKVGSMGHGPGEFIEISDFTIDPENELIYVLDNRRQVINIFNLETGDFIRTLKLNGDNIRSFHIQFVDGQLYTDAYSWKKSDDNFLLRGIDVNSGNQMKSWLRPVEYNKNFTDLYFTGSGVFYSRNNSQPKFIQLFMDTVVSVGQNSVSPFIAIHSKKLITQKDIANAKGSSIEEKMSAFLTMDKIYQIQSFVEFGSKMYFEFRHGNAKNFVVYDIDSQETLISRRLINDMIYNENAKNFLLPRFCHSDDNGVYGYVHPFEMDRFLESAKQNQLSASLDRIDEIKALNENANPILFLYQLK